MRWSFVLILLGCSGPESPTSPVPTWDGVPNPSTAGLVSESFEAAALPPVDVLFVLDTSCFSEEQEAMGATIGSLLQHLRGRDWHMGIVSADMGRPDHRGRLLGAPRFMTSATSEAAQVFADNVALGRDGAIDERFFDATEAALGGTLPENDGFRRAGAALELVYATDDDDEGAGSVADTVRGLREHGDVRMHVLSGGFEGWCETRAPSRLWEVQEAFEGVRGDRCDEDLDNYEQFFDRIGTELRAEATFLLEGRAVPGEIEVAVVAEDGTITSYVDGEHDPVCDGCPNFVFTGREIHLFPPPLPGGVVEVSYIAR